MSWYNNMNKYGNTRVEYDGHTFDSKKECERYKVLVKLEAEGKITDLQLQKSFEVIPSQKDSEGKTLEYSANYIADFCYYRDGELIVEDVKGYKTPEYVLKRKLMLYRYGIRITESC